MEATLKENETVNMPDGTAIKSFWILNGAGHRISKVTGNLKEESYGVIFRRALTKCMEMRGGL